MLMRRILYTCCLLPIWGWSEQASEKNDPAALEQKIQTLNDRLQQARFKQMDEEVKGQALMIDDWAAYSKELEKVHKMEEKERELENEIQQLEQQKDTFLKQSKKGS